MIGMFGLYLPSPEERERERKWVESEKARRMLQVEDWNPKMPWKEEMNLRASSFHPPLLFSIPVSWPEDPSRIAAKAEHFVDSPTGEYRYVNVGIKAGTALGIYSGSKKGTVMFDGGVVTPALFQKHPWESGGWTRAPWMSLTPMEMISLRGGTRLAKGTVVVAGLGLGYQLGEVLKREKVKEVILVERSGELVEWLLPRIRRQVGEDLFKKLTKVVVGDAYVELPKLTADVALVDIFPDYGNNDWEQDRLRKTCPNIGHIWCWGTAKIG